MAGAHDAPFRSTGSPTAALQKTQAVTRRRWRASAEDDVASLSFSYGAGGRGSLLNTCSSLEHPPLTSHIGYNLSLDHSFLVNSGEI